MHRHVAWWIAALVLSVGPRVEAQGSAPSEEKGSSPAEAEAEAEDRAQEEEQTGAEDAEAGAEDAEAGTEDAEADDDTDPDEGEEKLGRNEQAAESLAEEARSRFRVGGTLYDEGRFRDAAAEFKKAYELSGKPELLFNMYIAYRDAGLIEQAVESLRGYLDEAEAIPDRRKLETRLQAMERTLQSRAPEAAGEPQDDAPEAAPVQEGTAPAEPAEGAPGGEAEGRSPLPWVITGVGAAAIVAATLTGIVSLNKTSDIEEACGPDNVCPSDFPLQDRRQTARRWTRATDALWPIGVAAIGTGLLLFFLMDGDAADEPAVEAGLGCASGGCAGEMRVRF